MSQLVKPHGSETLNILLLEGAERESALAAAEALPKITLSSRERGDLIMLGIGGFTPLDGFMGKADWQGVCDNMALANGVFWPIPITLSTDQAVGGGLVGGQGDRDRPEHAVGQCHVVAHALPVLSLIHISEPTRPY